MAIRRGHEIGCDAVQVFTSSPQMWKAKPVTEEAASLFKQALAETGIQKVVSHDSYLVNLCNPDPAIREKSRNALKDEVLRCHQFGIPWVVSHIGAHLGQGIEVGIRAAAEELKALFDETPENVMVLAETTAGQGSALDDRFEQIAMLFECVQGSGRLGVCLDTCHIFAAGYDIRSAESYEQTFEEFNQKVGIDHLKVIHCNDSKKPLGSRVDRHENIGEGEIGFEGFRCLVNDPRWENVPIILETPNAETHHKINLEVLRSLQEKCHKS